MTLRPIIALHLLASTLWGLGMNPGDSLSSKSSVTGYLLKHGIEFEKVEDSALFIGAFGCLYNLEERNLGWRYSRIHQQIESRNVQDSIVSVYLRESNNQRKLAAKDVLTGAGILVIGASIVEIANLTLLDHSSDNTALSINAFAFSFLVGSYFYQGFQGAKKSDLALAYLRMAVTRSNDRLFARCCPTQNRN